MADSTRTPGVAGVTHAATVLPSARTKQVVEAAGCGRNRGILLRKYWFSVSDAVQEERFRRRLQDPTRRWKLSSMDLESITCWEAYSRAKDEIFVHTDISEASWYVVESDDKRRARLNMISHLLSTVPYEAVDPPVSELPPRPLATGYQRPPRDLQTYVPDHASRLGK